MEAGEALTYRFNCVMNSSNANQAYEVVQGTLQAISHAEKFIKDLKKNYEREKAGIEAKVNCATAIKNSLYKNAKVENKINSFDSTTENKLQYFDEQIKLNEEKRSRDIQATKDKFEAKMNAEINDINARADKYENYINSQRKMLEAKKNTVIRDLSANIIVPNIGDTFDEDAYPRLTKLKFDIEVEEANLIELRKTKELQLADYNRCFARDATNREHEARRVTEEIERAERTKVAMAREQLANQREASRKADEARWERQKQERIKAEAIKVAEEKFNKNVYSNLSAEYKQYYKHLTKEQRTDLYDMTLDDVNDYIGDVKDKLANYIKMERLSTSDDKYFKSEIWDMYNDLPYDKRYEIAQMNKPAQLAHIKKYHNELDPSDSD